MTPIKILYFGSPKFSANILRALIQNPSFQIVGVVTNPDSTQGRDKVITPTPVCQTAIEYDLPVYKPQTLDEANLAHLKLLKADLFLVVSYGKIIPDNYLSTPPKKVLNIHFSLLPKYRGGLCISEPIKNQDPQTGVTLMEMTSKLDSGPILSQKIVDISTEDTQTSLTEKLSQAAISLLNDSLPKYTEGSLTAKTQDETLATYTAKAKTQNHQNAFIDPEALIKATNGQDSYKISALIRSLTPEPGAWSKINNKEFKILSISISSNKLTINQVQVPGKNPISWKQFNQ